MIKGLSITDVGTDVAVLSVMAVLLVIASVKKFKVRLE
jgi:hypothetical protein